MEVVCLHREGTGRKRVPHVFFYFSWMLFFLLLSNVMSATAGEGVGKVSAVEGNVDVLRGGALPAVPLKVGDSVSVGDVVRTKSDARVEISFEDGTVLRVAPQSRIDISEYVVGSRGTIKLPRGKLQAVVNKDLARKAGLKEGNRFEVHTPNAVAGVRGTDFFVYHQRNVTGVLVREGTVYAYNPVLPKMVVNVPAGTVTTVLPKSAPQPPRAVTEGDVKRFERDVTPKDKGKEKAEEGQTGEKSQEQTKAEEKPREQGKNNEKPGDKAGEKGRSAGEQGRADGKPPAADTGTPQSTSSAPGFLAPPSGIAAPEPNILTASNPVAVLTGSDPTSALSNNLGNTNINNSPVIIITENPRVQPELTSKPITVTLTGKPSSLTNTNTANFSATSSEAGVTYTYTLDGNPVPSGSLSGLSEGLHTIVLTATDGSNTSEPVRYTWTVDTVAPVVSMTGGPGTMTNSKDASFNVSVQEQGATTTYTLDGQPVSSPVLSDLTDGKHTFEVIATDLAGNVTWQQYSWTVDTIAPSLSASGVPGSLTNKKDAAFAFTVTNQEEGVSYSYKLDGAVVPSASLSNLTDGKHTFEVTATDLVGNTTAQQYTWTVDTVAPVVSMTGGPGTMTNSKDASFNVSVQEQGTSTTYTLDGNPVSSGNLTNLSEGPHTFTATVTDPAGNAAIQTYTWTTDYTAPTISLSGKAVTNSRSANFQVNSTETGVTYSYTLDGVKVDSTGLSNLSEGPHTLVMTATDEAGNTSSPVSYAWTTDYTAPSVLLTGKPFPVTNANTASFSATSTEQGVAYTYTLDGQPVSSGSLSDLPEGSHTLIVTGTDEAGNPSEPVSYTWTTDYTAPVVTAKTAGASPTGGTTTTVNIALSSSEAATYSYSLAGPVSSSGTGTSGTLTLTGLTAGSYTLTYSLTDTAGNSTSYSEPFTLNRYSLTGNAAGSGFSGSVSSGNASGILDGNWGGWSLVLSGGGSLSPTWKVTAGGSIAGGGYWVDSLFSSGVSDFSYLTPYVLGSGAGSVSVSGSGPYTFTDSGTGLTESSLSFVSGIMGGLMFRDRYSTNPLWTNYTAPTPEGTLDAYMGGTASLWSGVSTPFVMIGTYVPSVDTNFSTKNYHWGWENPVKSHNYTTGYDTTYDSGAYYGYASGITLHNDAKTEGVLYALYVDPTGKAGILKGSFGQGADTGDLYSGAGMWYAEGSLERVQILGSTSFADPSTISWSATDPANDLASANVFTVTGPVVKDWVGTDDSSGGAFDPVLGKREEFQNTGSIMKFSYLQDTSSTKYNTFGIWQMESFGSFDTSLIGSNSRWMLSSESAWDVAPLVADTKSDYLSLTRIYGDGVTNQWRSDGTRGKAYGAIADWSAGKTMLLAGEALGTYNTYTGGPVSIEINRQPGGNDDGVCDGGEKCATADADYGILTTGAWIETSAFLANPSAYASLGFAATNAGSVPGLKGGWLNAGDSLYAYMDGTNSSSPITLFSDASGIRQWASGSITGTYTGAIDSTWGTWISNNASPASATLFGSLDFERWEGSTWMGEMELLGGIDGVFQGFLEGVAAGSYGGGSFSGTAAGTFDKMDAISKINTNVVKSWNGTLTSGDGGFLYGALGIGDPWAGDELEILGYHTLANTGVAHTWYQEVEPYNYLDSSYRKTTSEDSTNTQHGSYFGYLGGAQGAIGPGGSGTMHGMLYALFIDPSGNAGILKGSSLYTTVSNEINKNGEWSLEFPINIGVLSSSPGITATQLYNPGNIVTTAPTPIWQADSGKFSTVGSITVVTGVNDTIRFNADSTPYTATIAPGTYTYAALATAVASALDAADPNPANTYTVSFNGGTNRFEITANTSIDYLWGDAATTAERILGFSPTDYPGWTANSPMGSTYTAGNIFVDGDYSRYKSASLTGQDWGIWQADLYGTYAGPTNYNWSLPLEMKNPGVSFTELEIAGSWDSGANTLKGSITGYGADISMTPRTFISIGETVGTFNPTTYTWQALGMGMSIDAGKLLTLAADTSAGGGRDALAKLQIPAFEVGRANLTGSASWAAGSETLAINMNNVVFFSSASGGSPSIWATNDFNGSSYTGASSFAGRTVTLIGNGVEVDFSVSDWSGGKWMATVGNSSGNPGPYTFSCVACPMNGSTVNQIKGAAAGLYGGGALTGSSATGVVK